MLSLEELNLSRNQLTEISVRNFTMFLGRHGSKLKKLILSYNKIGDGAATFSVLMMTAHSGSIEYIDISFCEMTTEGKCWC